VAKDEQLAAQWLADVHGIQVNKESAKDSILYIAQSNPFNPIAEYLDRVRTDPFLGRVSPEQLAALFGIDPTDHISRELLCRHLGGQARRGLQPGCKYDQMGILVGPQGNGKTEAIRALSSPAWVDGLGDTKKSLDDREVLAKVNGCWGFEIGECDRFLRGRLAAEIKDWLTYQTDCYCEKYESIAVDHPRRSAIWGTSNEDELLNDPTGSRRFWITHTPNKIDWQQIGLQRDVIWASVLDWLDRGMPTFVDDADPLWKEVNQHIADRNKSHSVEDAWEGPVIKYLGVLRNTGIDFVTAADLLQHAVQVPIERHDGKAMGRIGRIMQSPHFAALGWSKRRTMRNGIQQRGWQWEPPPPPPASQQHIPGLP
jgi:predicted P-loop ATPase